MYSSYLTRETFENEHDEKMTRKFSYNYQVLKRLFPEVYKLPESEIRSLVHSIYDNPKMGDELLDHLSDVINKKKPEWGEYLNPKPEEPEQTVQNNPLQPVQPKPLNTSLGFEPYKPQKSAFGLGNTGGFGNAGGLGNTSAFGFNNTNNFGTTGGLKQSQLPNFSKGMDLKHSDMVTGFGINEAKQKEMFGTGFSMPKLPKLPQFPKAPEPQTPELPQMQPMNNFQKLQAEQMAANIRPKNIHLGTFDRQLLENPLLRQVGFGLQGIANAGLNPFGYIARYSGLDTAPLTANNFAERAMEKASRYGYDMATLATLGNIAQGAGLLGNGISDTSITARAFLAPEVLPATAMAAGGGIMEGMLNPQSEWLRLGSNMLGGMLGAPNVLNQIWRQGFNYYTPQWLKRGLAQYGNNAVEVLDFAPTRDRLMNYPAESSFNLPKEEIPMTQAKKILYDKALQSGIKIGGDIEHYLFKRGRGQYVRTLSNTLKRPDIIYSQNGRDYIVKKYNRVIDGKIEPFNDFIIKQDGELYNKFIPDKLGYVDNQINGATQKMSLRGNILEVEPTSGLASNSNIAMYPAVVNRNLQNITKVYEGLSNTQMHELNDALVKALQKTGTRAGTFESLTALKREVNSKVLENENLMPIKEAVDKAWNEALDIIVKQQFKPQSLNITLPMQMQYGSALLNNTFDDY